MNSKVGLRALSVTILLGLVVSLALSMTQSNEAQSNDKLKVAPKTRMVKVTNFKGQPIRIVAVKVRDKVVPFNEGFVEESDWVDHLRYVVKNVSDEPVAYAEVGSILKHNEGDKTTALLLTSTYGTEPAHGDSIAIPPGGEAEVNYSSCVGRASDRWRESRDRRRRERSRAIVTSGLEEDVSFVKASVRGVFHSSKPDVLWHENSRLIRDPKDPTSFLIDESYAPPEEVNETSPAESVPEATPLSKDVERLSPDPSIPNCDLQYAGLGDTGCTGTGDTSYLRPCVAKAPKFHPGVADLNGIYGAETESFCTGNGLSPPGTTCQRTCGPNRNERCVIPITEVSLNCNRIRYASPLVLDINGDGILLTKFTGGVEFNFDGVGRKELVAWTTPSSDDAWLALDRDGNNRIDSSLELFGDLTQQPTSDEPNGFLALAEYDKSSNGGNRDGKISSQDTIFSNLRLWQDVNHNGISEPSELHTLPSLGVAQLDHDYRESRRTDEHGNHFRYRAKVRDAQGAQVGRWAWDVFLQMTS